MNLFNFKLFNFNFFNNLKKTFYAKKFIPININYKKNQLKLL